MQCHNPVKAGRLCGGTIALSGIPTLVNQSFPMPDGAVHGNSHYPGTTVEVARQAGRMWLVFLQTFLGNAKRTCGLMA
jgi:hypothetical protein